MYIMTTMLGGWLLRDSVATAFFFQTNNDVRLCARLNEQNTGSLYQLFYAPKSKQTQFLIKIVNEDIGTFWTELDMSCIGCCCSYLLLNSILFQEGKNIFKLRCFYWCAVKQRREQKSSSIFLTQKKIWEKNHDRSRDVTAY